LCPKEDNTVHVALVRRVKMGLGTGAVGERGWSWCRFADITTGKQGGPNKVTMRSTEAQLSI
jgi:hypothetical protein